MRYITPDDYARAKANGLSRFLVQDRVYSYGWDVEKAVTTPKKISKNHGEWTNKALENGISRTTFYKRVSQGWSYEDAVSKPLVSPKESQLRSADVQRTYPKAYGLIADAHGINRQTFRNRLKLGWPLITAATEPPMTRWERKAIRDARADGSRLQES